MKPEKDKKKTVLALFVLVIAFGYFLVTGVLEVTNTKDIKYLKPDGAVEILSVEHSINGLIPVGKDHFYFVGDAEGNAFIVKETPRWYKKHFSEETGDALDKENFIIRGLAKSAGDFNVKEELAARVASINNEGYGFTMLVNADRVVDPEYMMTAIVKILLAVLMIALFFWGKRIVGNGADSNPTEVKIFAVVLIVYLVLLLKTII